MAVLWTKIVFILFCEAQSTTSPLVGPCTSGFFRLLALEFRQIANILIILLEVERSYFKTILYAQIWLRKEICSISSRSRVLAHRPCPKLEMFCPSVLQLFYGCSKVLMTNHGMRFLFCFYVFQTGWRSELSYPSPWPCESGLTS